MRQHEQYIPFTCVSAVAPVAVTPKRRTVNVLPYLAVMVAVAVLLVVL